MTRIILLFLMLVVLCHAGCVRRRMTIRSNPEGAVVHVDNQPIGLTPASTSFTYYATREIRLEKDGYETLTVKHKFRRPWWQIPPLDFITDNFWPSELRDERVLNLQMAPRRFVPEKQFLQNANQLRSGARQGAVTPLIVPQPQALPQTVPQTLPLPRPPRSPLPPPN